MDRTAGGTTPQVIIVGAGLAGLVAAYEATQAGLRVLMVEQENRNNLGGQAFWSLGGLFMVDTPEQRLMRVRDSEDLAWRDWSNSAGFSRADDTWPVRWAREYVRFATRDMRPYLRNLGLRVLPTVGWAERGSGDASGHGNSVPRFHLTWGTGPEVVRVFAEPLLEAERRGLLQFRFRHRVEELITEQSADGPGVVGIRGSVLAECELPLGKASSRDVVDQFELRAPATVVTTGGIGGDLELVRRSWPTDRWGPVPKDLVRGVPAHVDGRMIGIARDAGANVVNTDRMWHYPEGMINWDPIWPDHGIRIIPGPSSLWIDAAGDRLPANLIPGGDNLTALAHIGRTGHGYSWFVANRTIVTKEFIFSGSEQNPDLTARTARGLVHQATTQTAEPIANFLRHGADWVTAPDVPTLVDRMNALVGQDHPQIDPQNLTRVIEDRDSQLDNPFCKDTQVNQIRAARKYLGDRLIRCAPPHRLLDPEHGPLVAIRLHILTRKTLGGLETDLDGQCLRPDGTPLLGLFAAGEVSGFGGGGMHGENALEGTFLGGCIHSGLRVGRALGAQLTQREGANHG